MTLAEISYWSRQTIKWGFFFLVFIIVGRAVFNIGYGIYRSFVPPAPKAPTVTFGKLPAIVFPRSKEGNYKFTLQTPTGELPKFVPSVVVYLMPQFQSSFLGVDEAGRMARGLGFNGSLNKVSPTIYRFEHSDVPKTLDINIVNKTFSISYNLLAKPEILTMRPPSTEEAQRDIVGYISSLDLLKEEYPLTQVGYEYLKTDGLELVPVSSLSESNFVRVNFFRKKYGELGVVTPQRTQSNVWFIVSGAGSGSSQVVAGEYHHFPVDESKASTYPIKTAEAAWGELNGGKAIIIRGLAEGKSDVTVRRVYLAYYDAGEPQQFFQPVVVFEGDGGFAAYVPAVSPQYYGVTTGQE